MTLAVIALGSNIDNPISRIREAFNHLQALSELDALRASALYESPPMGPQDQPAFFNAVVCGDYAGEPLSLLASLQAIEQSMGRVKNRRWGERCIDLDLVQFGDQKIDLPNLTIPHPGVAHRLFVVQPMIDILGAEHKVPGLPELGTLREALCSETLTLCQTAVIG